MSVLVQEQGSGVLLWGFSLNCRLPAILIKALSVCLRFMCANSGVMPLKGQIYILWNTSKNNRRFGGTSPQVGEYVKKESSMKQVARTATLNVKATCFPETSINFKRTTRCYIPEDITVHNHRCHNLKSYTSL
jgi:hypothetical protein